MLQIRIWVFGVSPAEPPDRRKALSDIEELRRNHGGTHLLGGTVEELKRNMEELRRERRI